MIYVVGVIFYIISLIFLSKFVNIVRALELNYLLLIYYILSALFLGIYYSFAIKADNRKLYIILSISALLVAYIFLNIHRYVVLFYLLLTVILFVKNKEKMISLFKQSPIIFSALLAIVLTVQGSSVMNYYLEKYIGLPVWWAAEPLVNDSIRASLFMMANISLQSFIQGYDSATYSAYAYTQDRSLLDYLEDTKKDLVENLTKTLHQQMRENYLPYAKKEVRDSIFKMINDLSIPFFILFILVLYSVMGVYISLAHAFMIAFNKLLKVNVKEQK